MDRIEAIKWGSRIAAVVILLAVVLVFQLMARTLRRVKSGEIEKPPSWKSDKPDPGIPDGAIR